MDKKRIYKVMSEKDADRVCYLSDISRTNLRSVYSNYLIGGYEYTEILVFIGVESISEIIRDNVKSNKYDTELKELRRITNATELGLLLTEFLIIIALEMKLDVFLASTCKFVNKMQSRLKLNKNT